MTDRTPNASDAVSIGVSNDDRISVCIEGGTTVMSASIPLHRAEFLVQQLLMAIDHLKGEKV